MRYKPPNVSDSDTISINWTLQRSCQFFNINSYTQTLLYKVEDTASISPDSDSVAPGQQLDAHLELKVPYHRNSPLPSAICYLSLAIPPGYTHRHFSCTSSLPPQLHTSVSPASHPRNQMSQRQLRRHRGQQVQEDLEQ